MPIALFRFFLAVAAVLSFALPAAAADGPPAADAIGRPPAAARQPVTERFFGQAVTDDYRWMEDMGSPEFQAFIEGQGAYARRVLDAIPGRAALARRIRELDNAVVQVTRASLHGGRYFYLTSAPGKAGFAIAMRDAEGRETVLVDPDRLATDETHYAIDYFLPSPDGRHVAYGLSHGGSERSVLHVVDSGTGRDLPETIDRTDDESLPSWSADGKGFFYVRFNPLKPGDPPADKFQNARAYYHRLGRSPERDVAVLGRGLTRGVAIDPLEVPMVVATPGSDILLGLLVKGVKSELTILAVRRAQLNGAATPWRKIVDPADQVTAAALHGRTLYLLTHKNAPRFRILRADLGASPSPRAVRRARVAVPEGVVPGGTGVITAMAAARDGLYLVEMQGGPSRLRRLAWGGRTAEALPMPFRGSVNDLAADPGQPGAVADLEGWVHPPLIARYDPAAGRLADTGLQPPPPLDTAAYQADEVTVPAGDGVGVPLSIVHRRGMRRDGGAPAVIWGYGAYGDAQPPLFSLPLLALLEKGAVWATCHVRGGGELGDDWHKAGQRANKPNSWKDLIACAGYLVAQGWTRPDRLAIDGGSSGGIVVGRAMTDRPDLFRVVIDEVGASNPLREEFASNGPPNIPEFGSVATPQGFRDLLAMDPLHHVRPGVAYPAVLLTAGRNDSRIDAWEPAKIAARLQDCSTSGRPVLLRYDRDAGHGLGSSRGQTEAELADKYAFFLWQAGHPAFQPTPAPPLQPATYGEDPRP